MAYWIETRYPVVTRDLLSRLYFHEGKLGIAMRMSVGDLVVQYETKQIPRERGPRGSQTIFAMGTVVGEVELLPEKQARRAGGKLWNIVRDFELRENVPLNRKDLGVPLLEACRILERMDNPRIRRTEEISESEFGQLAAALHERVESVPVAMADTEEAAEAEIAGLARQRGQSTQEIAARLLTLIADEDPRPPVKTATSGFEYRTNKGLAGTLKALYQGRCQFCGTTFEKEDGTPYCEAHHIRALADGGHDVAANMLVLCPTCHRKMHHAHVSRAAAALTRRTVSINGEEVTVTIRPEHAGGPL